MSNLLPLHARKQILYEYWVRVVSVWLILGTAALTIVAVLKTPTFFLIDTQLDIISEEYADAQATEAAFTAVSSTITEANALAIFLNEPKDAVTFTELIAELERITARGVSLETLAVSKTAGVITEVRISGIAETRTTLQTLRDTILASPYFASADIPLSNFAKEREIDFSITIEPATSTP